MKLRLIVNVVARGQNIELGTLEYREGKYVWTTGNVDLEDGVVEDFFQISGLASEGKEEGEELFAFFKSRITKNRNGEFFKEKLKRLDMKEYAEWEYICKTGLKTAIDTYELVVCE